MKHEKKGCKGKKVVPKSYVFRFKPPTREFSLEIKFAKTKVEKDELIETLVAILDALKADTAIES